MRLWKRLLSYFQKNDSDATAALREFIFNIYRGDDLSPVQARQNIEAGLLEFVYSDNGDHACNGLLITENGYMLTSYHCVKNGFDDFCVLSGRDRFVVERICEVDRERDIALIKINKEGLPKACVYPFLLDINSLKIPAVVLLSRWNFQIKESYGFFLEEKDLILKTDEQPLFKNQNFCRIASEQGDSGGILLDCDFRILGINNGVAFDGVSSEAHSSTIFDCLSLIVKFCRKEANK